MVGRLRSSSSSLSSFAHAGAAPTIAAQATPASSGTRPNALILNLSYHAPSRPGLDGAGGEGQLITVIGPLQRRYIAEIRVGARRAATYRMEELPDGSGGPLLGRFGDRGHGSRLRPRVAGEPEARGG